MGGSQSSGTVTSQLFNYDCNPHVSMFISNNQQHLEELKRVIEDYAELKNIANGQVQLTGKKDVAVTTQDDCKKKLDDFFSSYLSFEETLDKTMSSFELDFILKSKGFNCDTIKDPSGKNVRITGVKSDVKTLITILRDYQNPTLVTDPTSNSNTSTTSATRFPVSSTVTMQGPLINFDDTLSFPSTSSQDHGMISRATAHDSTNFQSTSDRSFGSRNTSKTENTSSNYTSPSVLPSRINENASSKFHQTEEYLPSIYQFSHPADDFSVARFIKYSREHTQGLKHAFSSLANAEVFEEKSSKTVEYRFHPIQFQKITPKEFDYRCKECLNKFLESYSSRKRRFNRERLNKAVQKTPEFFGNVSGRDNGELHVQWHLNDFLVILSGLKNKVQEKENEIVQFLDETAPRSMSFKFVFKIPASDFSVARFLQQSKINSSKLEIIIRDFATIKFWNAYNDKSDKSSNPNEKKNRKKIEFHFKPKPDCELSEDEFKLKCRSTLDAFLALYSSAKKFFNHEHLMKAVKKDPNYFKAQSAQERELLYVEWRLDKNKVSLTGLKCDVDRKLQEITAHLDRLVPRTLKELYEFDSDPPSLVAAKFIKENAVHLEAFRESLTNARVWITPGSFKLHFKATAELQQHDIPHFEDDCKNSAKKFFKNINVWKPKYSAPLVEATTKSDPELFGISETNCKSEVSDENEIILVGFKQRFFKIRSDIQKALDRNDAIHKAKKTKQHQKRNPSGEPSFNDSPQNVAFKLEEFVYEPKAKANLNVLKHVFQSPLDMENLRGMIGLLVQFEPFPNAEEPVGLRVFPTLGASIDVDYYTQVVPARFAEFFERFLVCRKQCMPHEETNLVQAVYACGKKYRIPERAISIHKENGFLNVVGPRHAIVELAEMVDGIKCEGVKVRLRQLPGASRKQSTSSNFSEPCTPNKKNPNKPKPAPSKNPNKPKPASSKNKKEKTFSFPYFPKQKYVPVFTFVWENTRFREELKSRCSDICVLTGTTQKLQISQKDHEKEEPLFSKKVVPKLEEFFDSISIEQITVDADVMQHFKENEEQWLKDHYDANDWIVINWNENGVELKGFKDYVGKYRSIIESELEEVDSVIKTPSEIARVLTVCGVIAETNRQLKGKVVVSCSVDDQTVSFSGRKCFHEGAKAKLGELGQLVEKPPITSPQKLNVLATLKSDNAEGIRLIEKKMAEKNIKCVLLLRLGKVILTAMTEEMYKKASKFLDQLIVSIDVPRPDGIAANFFKQKAWNDLVTEITESKKVFVCEQSDFITLSGLNREDLKKAADKVTKYFDSLLVKASEIQCPCHVSRFIMTFHARKTLTLTPTESGFQIEGPAKDVDAFVAMLRGIKWSRCQLNFVAPELMSHFNSSNWKVLVKILEQEIRCTIHSDLSKCPHGSNVEETISSSYTSQTRENFDFNNVKVASYGEVMVSVRHGDICSDDSDVIVNGVISTDFNLSQGAISSALLRRAGRNLQHECDSADKSSPVIRHTRGLNLLCGHVIHMVTPSQPEVLTKRLKDVLDHAELLRAKSVAIPTLGAGGVGLQAADVASSMSKALELFAHSKPRYVRDIKVVVYDLPIVDLFQTSIVQAKELLDFGKRAVELSESKYQSLLGDEVTVHVNCDDSVNLQLAKKRIDEHMSNVIVTKTIKVENFSDLDDHDRSDIYEAAAHHKASVTFNSFTSEIILRGLHTNVSKLYEVTREMTYELREAITLSKMYVWKWANSSGLFTALPLRVSRALEKKYEQSKTGSHHVSMYGSYFVVNFSNMTYDFKTITGELKREDSEKIPPYWTDMMGKPWLKVSLDPTSSEFHRVLNLFKASNPSYTSISKIERIQNPSLYKQYLIKKNDVQRHMRSKEPVERELFHGTSSTDAEKICADNFDRSFSGKNATVYGKGCYFAVDSSYSVKYATNPVNTTSCVFLAKVLTGDFCRGNSSMVSPPDKLHSGGIPRKYDSVVDNESSPTMFVVFKDTSVYPAYLISFL